MKRALSLLCLPLLTLSLAAGCDKGGDTTPPGGDVAPPDPTPAPDPEPAPEPEVTPQDEPPAEVAEARTQFLLGNYEAVIGAMEPLASSLTGDSQKLGNAMANSWLALAHSDNLVDAAKDPAERAVALATEIRDPAAEQLARTAHAAYLLNVNDPAAAEAEAQKATELEGPETALAKYYLSMAIMRQAFDSDDGRKLEDKSKLEAAVPIAEAVVAEATDDALKARSDINIAEMKRFLGDKEGSCSALEAAEAAYEAAGASDYLKEVVPIIRKSAKCKK